MDTRLNQNEAELRVLILAVLLEVATNVDSLLDQVVKILGDLGGQASLLEDAENLSTGDRDNLGDTHGVTEANTNLRGGKTLLGALLFLAYMNDTLHIITMIPRLGMNATIVISFVRSKWMTGGLSYLFLFLRLFTVSSGSILSRRRCLQFCFFLTSFLCGFFIVCNQSRELAPDQCRQ